MEKEKKISLLGDAQKALADKEKLFVYRKQEEILKSLVKEFPNNTNQKEVDLKVKTLNLYYSTGITATKKMVENIVKRGKKIDQMLKDGDRKVVELIATLSTSKGVRINYSFATKYCALHQPKKFPIYDSIVATIFGNFFMQGRLADYTHSSKFTRKEFETKMHEYPFYVKLYDSFMKQYGLTKLDYREVDNYLWGAHKIANRKYEIVEMAKVNKKIDKENI